MPALKVRGRSSRIRSCKGFPQVTGDQLYQALDIILGVTMWLGIGHRQMVILVH